MWRVTLESERDWQGMGEERNHARSSLDILLQLHVATLSVAFLPGLHAIDGQSLTRRLFNGDKKKSFSKGHKTLRRRDGGSRLAVFALWVKSMDDFLLLFLPFAFLLHFRLLVLLERAPRSRAPVLHLLFT